METVARATDVRHSVTVAMVNTVRLTSKPLARCLGNPLERSPWILAGEGWGLEEAEVSEQAEVVLP